MNLLLLLAKAFSLDVGLEVSQESFSGSMVVVGLSRVLPVFLFLLLLLLLVVVIGIVMFVGVAEYALHDDSSDGALWWARVDTSRTEVEWANEEGVKRMCLGCEKGRGECRCDGRTRGERERVERKKKKACIICLFVHGK